MTAQIAKGSFKVKLQPLPFEGQEEGTSLARMSIDKEISGDLTATTRGQMLAAGTGTPGSAGYVAVELVTGSVGGRSGSFALMHTGLMNRGAPSLKVSVVPDSGTGELTGLAGDFDIQISAGQHNYEFRYTLPGEELG
jgi:hypothetical protein